MKQEKNKFIKQTVFLFQNFFHCSFLKERNKSFFFLIVFKSSQEIVLIYTVCIALKLNSSLYETTAPRAAEHSVVLPTSALQQPRAVPQYLNIISKLWSCPTVPKHYKQIVVMAHKNLKILNKLWSCPTTPKHYKQIVVMSHKT